LATSALTCVASEISNADARAGVTESQLCEPTVEAIGQLTLQTYADTAGLREAWQADTETTTDLVVDEDICANATPGADKWGFGNVVCGVSEGKAQIRWTDTRSGNLGVVVSETDDLAALHEWWEANARPLGRGLADQARATEKTRKPTPAPRKLVRVPGKPGNATCARTIAPIQDEWGRTWRITKVNFRNEVGYERVVVQLERTGKNRSAKPTQAKVARMTLNGLRRTHANAPKPTKGKLAVVLDITGIDDGPTIYNYAPSGLDYVKQLSVFKNNGGYATSVTTPSAICYQVRIPIWSPAATGNEDRAEIYIDLTPR
jgi:hypothetical protein